MLARASLISTVNFCSKLYCLTKKKIKNIIIKNISVENIELSPFRLQITMQFWEYYTYVRYNQYEISFMKRYEFINLQSSLDILAIHLLFLHILILQKNLDLSNTPTIIAISIKVPIVTQITNNCLATLLQTNSASKLII